MEEARPQYSAIDAFCVSFLSGTRNIDSRSDLVFFHLCPTVFLGASLKKMGRTQ